LNLGFSLQIAVLLFSAYCIYRLIRAFVLAWQKKHPSTDYSPISETQPMPPLAGDAAGASPAGTSVQEQRRQELLAARRRYKKAVPTLVLGTPRERVAELLGSLLLSSVVAVAMTVVMVLLSSFEDAVPKPEQCAWMLLTTVIGSWIVLIPSKFWEGTNGDPALRRFVMMVMGLMLGALSYLVSLSFIVTLPPAPNFHNVGISMPSSFYGIDGRPMLMAYLASFGTLFFMLRWWLQADPLRKKRVRIWSLLVSMVMAMIIAAFLHFPQPWLPMVAGAISISVQLSSPWADPRKQTMRKKG